MKLIQLNVERDKHLARWVPFLKNENADIICLQEVLEPTYASLSSELGMHCTYIPTTLLQGFEDGTDGLPWGIALCSKVPHTVLGVHRYDELPDTLPTVVNGKFPGDIDIPTHRVLLVVQVGHVAGAYIVGCTHGTWTCDGRVRPVQERTFAKLLAHIRTYPELLLCGDLNMPRATNLLYDEFSKHLTDNVPRDIESTLDPVFHRVPSLRHVVDYIWSTPEYTVRNVRVVCGLSDHCALVAEVGHE